MRAINDHTALSVQVIKTLVYFDIFRYPLKSDEVFHFLRTNGTTHRAVEQCLNDLTEKKHLFRFGDLYCLLADEKNISRRLQGNVEAERWLKVATAQGQFIGKFPFVRAVMASGSLSKGYMDKRSDLDFFIVTAPGRLWIARTLLVLYKRIFLLNSHKKFCVNYFVDTLHLEIEEKNLFTATELATLIPLYNYEYYQRLLAANNWLAGFFPNFKARPKHPEETASGFGKRFFEFLLTPLSVPLDRFFMRMTLARWEKLYLNKLDKEDFQIAFKTLRYVSKNHPNNYQKKVLDLYQLKLGEYARLFGSGAEE